ncbi:unnamed protein product [Symbiodinium natans]|uniref:Uncharacterized protein n=2 Tax=Symbiodinium natans TaxID=878477 RepID=A0A812PN74_9DINO|nr:unnamed protein product [Symbiodinium natans]
MDPAEDMEHAPHRWLSGQVADHQVAQVLGPQILQRWQALLVSIVEEDDTPIITDTSSMPARPWTTNLHPSKYMEMLSTTDEGISNTVNRFRQQTMKAKILHQSRLRAVQTDYPEIIGQGRLQDMEIKPGRVLASAENHGTMPHTLPPPTSSQDHANQFQRWYPNRQTPPQDHATGMSMDYAGTDQPVRDLQTWHTGAFPHIPVPPDRTVPPPEERHHREDRSRSPLRNPGVHTMGMHVSSLQQLLDSLEPAVDAQSVTQHHDQGRLRPVLPVDQIEKVQPQWWRRPIRPELVHMLPPVEPHHWELQEDGTPVIRFFPNRMTFLPKQLVHKFPSLQQELQNSILMTWDQYKDDASTHVQMARYADSVDIPQPKPLHLRLRALLHEILSGTAAVHILQFTAIQFRMLVRKGTCPDLATMPNIYQLWHWGYIKFRSVNPELWMFTHNFADPRTMGRLEQTCTHFHRVWSAHVLPSTAGLVPLLPPIQDLCVVLHSTTPPFHQPMLAKYNTISGIMTMQAVSNIVFRKAHHDLQLHRTWPSIDSHTECLQGTNTFQIPDHWSTNIWTDTLQKLTHTTRWTPPSTPDIRTKLTIDHLHSDTLPTMVWTPRFALPLTSQQIHAVQVSTQAAHVLHRLWDPLIFTFADPCHTIDGFDAKRTSRPDLIGKFHRLSPGGQTPMLAIPASSVMETQLDWAWFQTTTASSSSFRWLSLPLAVIGHPRTHSVFWTHPKISGQIQRHQALHVHQTTWLAVSGTPTAFQEDPDIKQNQAQATPTQEEWTDFINQRQALLELQRRTTVDQEAGQHQWKYVK